MSADDLEFRTDGSFPLGQVNEGLERLKAALPDKRRQNLKPLYRVRHRTSHGARMLERHKRKYVPVSPAKYRYKEEA